MTISRLKHLLPILLFGTSAAFAQRHELALSLGRFTGGDRLFSGVALGGAYSYRLTNRLIREGVASLYLEVPFAAGPLQNVKLKDPRATRDLATFFITPAMRVKFAPDAAVSPFFSIGGG